MPSIERSNVGGVTAAGVVRGDVHEHDLARVTITEPTDLDVNPEHTSAMENRRIMLPEEAGGARHGVEEKDLRSRVRGWLILESNWNPFWCCADRPDGKLIVSGYQNCIPPIAKQEFARDVMRHLNRTIANQGAWIVAWLYNGRRFYMLWKDKDGDIQVPIECDRPFFVLRTWNMDDFNRHAVAALGVWSEWHRNLDASKSQGKKVAQGEKLSAAHHVVAPDLSI